MLLLNAKIIMTDSGNIELARLKKDEDRNVLFAL